MKYTSMRSKTIFSVLAILGGYIPCLFLEGGLGWAVLWSFLSPFIPLFFASEASNTGPSYEPSPEVLQLRRAGPLLAWDPLDELAESDRLENTPYVQQ